MLSSPVKKQTQEHVILYQSEIFSLGFIDPLSNRCEESSFEWYFFFKNRAFKKKKLKKEIEEISKVLTDFSSILISFQKE